MESIFGPRVERAVVIAGGIGGLAAIAFKWSVAGDQCGGTDTAVTFGALLDSSAWSYGFLAGLGLAFGSAFVSGRLSLALQIAGSAAATVALIFLWQDATTPFEAAGRGGAVGQGCALYPAPGLWLATAAALLMDLTCGFRARREVAAT